MTMPEIAKAYVQIVPTTKGIKGQLEKELGVPGGEIGDRVGKSFIGSLTKALLGTAAVKGAVDGLKNIIGNYADYEQLVGGAALMFGDAFDTVAENAKNAYKTVQLSQNDYLTQVNGFATGLKTALGGSEQEAALLADKIVTAEADVVAATGNSREAVENAFNGIMRSNFTMVDNLQLGITPTKEGFQDLIDSVNAWNAENGEATQYTIDNVADCQAALVDYIDMQGLAGYAANEAAGTIQGSTESMKAAWQNLLTGVADENADFGTLVSEFTDSLATYAENLIPRIGIATEGVGTVLNTFVEQIIPQIVDYVTEHLPEIIRTGVNLVLQLVVGLLSAIPKLAGAVPKIIRTVVQTIVELLPDLWEAGKEIVNGVFEGIESMRQAFFDSVKGFFTGIVDGVKNLLGIASPSKVFAEIGGYMAEGLGVGFGDEIGAVQREINNDLTGFTADISASAVSVNASLSSGADNSAHGAANAIVNGLSTLLPNQGQQSINLVTPDGSALARWIFNPLKSYARSNGTPIVSPV